MTLYNLTNITSANNMGDAILGINSLMGGAIGLTIVVAMYLIIFLSMKFRGAESKDAFAVSGFITVTISLLAYPMGLIGGKILFIVVVLGALSAGALFYNP